TSDAFKQHLTVRERECLAFAAHGKSSEETAYELGISKMTVDGYREEIKRKLEAVNITQAVFEAVKHGYLGAFDKVWSRSEETKA
ncbi:helix-turn-helix transcriptional regulator, partial [Acinetobacter baumannii]